MSFVIFFGLQVSVILVIIIRSVRANEIAILLNNVKHNGIPLRSKKIFVAWHFL